MRIEGQQILPSDAAKSISDLIGRLDTGDIVRAKVLEISSDEAVLRLFDGSVIKAMLAEKIDAKAGQTIMLTVANKINGTLVLETVKQSNQSNIFQHDILKGMLEALNLTADSNNLSLISEFVNISVSPSDQQMKDALILLQSSPDINAEKAVFLASKGIKLDIEDIDTIAKLLGGEIKLGEIIKDIESAVDDLRSNIFSMMANTGSEKGQDIIRIVAAAVNKAFENATAQISNIDEGTSQGSGIVKETPISSVISSTHSPTESSAQNSVPSSPQSPALSSSKNPALSSSKNSTQSTDTSSTRSATIGSEAADNRSTQNEQSNTVNSSNSANKGNNESIRSRQAGESVTSEKQAININMPEKSDIAQIKDPFVRLKESIEQIFVRIKAEELPLESDLKSLEAQINKKLDLLRTVATLPELAQLEEGREISEAVLKLNDTVKAMNHLINNNIAYYQLPINLPGHRTAAEIYIMKNKQKKRKIDPQDSVMFISLETKNIGRVESLIVLKYKNVSINFRTEKQQIIDFGKENIKSLYEGLDSIGYKLVNIKYELLDTPTPPVGIEKLITKFIKENQSKVDLRI